MAVGTSHILETLDAIIQKNKGVGMIETKIIIKNYLRQAEIIKDRLEYSLPQEFRETGKNLLNQNLSWFPILSGLESFIKNLEEDLKEYKAVE